MAWDSTLEHHRTGVRRSERLVPHTRTRTQAREHGPSVITNPRRRTRAFLLFRVYTVRSDSVLKKHEGTRARASVRACACVNGCKRACACAFVRALVLGLACDRRSDSVSTTNINNAHGPNRSGSCGVNYICQNRWRRFLTRARG